MISARKMFRVFTLAAALGLAAVAPSQAAIISISPASEDVVFGDNVFVDVVVSGLAPDESVGGASFFLSFDTSILTGVGFTLDPDATMGVIDDLSGGFTGGTGSPLDIFFLADITFDHAALKLNQGASFTLATIQFQATGNGLTPLTLSTAGPSGAFLSLADGFTDLPATAVNGDVCVIPAGTAPSCPRQSPEPGTMALLLVGFGAAVARRSAARRRG